MDARGSVYRNGGGRSGAGLSLCIVEQAILRLAPGGTLVLYTNAAIVNGENGLLADSGRILTEAGFAWTSEEIDPDLFGDEIDAGAMDSAGRIAVLRLMATRPGRAGTMPEGSFTLGAVLRTFSHALMVLRSVRTQDEGAFTPHLSLSVGRSCKKDLRRFSAKAMVTQQLSRSAQAAQEVTMNIGGVSQAANGTGNAANQVLGAATGLSQQSDQLAAEVNSFVAGVRAA